MHILCFLTFNFINRSEKSFILIVPQNKLLVILNIPKDIFRSSQILSFIKKNSYLFCLCEEVLPPFEIVLQFQSLYDSYKLVNSDIKTDQKQFIFFIVSEHIPHRNFKLKCPKKYNKKARLRQSPFHVSLFPPTHLFYSHHPVCDLWMRSRDYSSDTFFQSIPFNLLLFSSPFNPFFPQTILLKISLSGYLTLAQNKTQEETSQTKEE